MGAPSPECASLMLPGTEVLLLAPFVLGLVLSWACFYGGDRALQRLSQSAESPAFWSRGTYVLFHLRHNLGLVAAPLVLMMTQRTLRWSLTGTSYEPVVPVLVATLLVGVFVSLPLVLRLVLGFRPMPGGHLNDRLQAAARRLRFRCRIFLWNTHGRITNAMVVGVIPRLRYVLLSDRLVEELTPEEVEAVFGHEVGHVKHHHILFYVGFFLLSVLVVFQIWNVATSRVPAIAEYFPATEDWAQTAVCRPRLRLHLCGFWLSFSTLRTPGGCLRLSGCLVCPCRLRVPWQRRRVAAGGNWTLRNGDPHLHRRAREGCATQRH